MRICVVSHYCKPHIGGIETVSFEQAKRLVKRGHQVTIVSSKILAQVDREYDEGIFIRRVKALNFLEEAFGIPYPILFPSSLRVLGEELEGMDLCVIHSFGFLSSLAAAWLCRKRQIPFVLYQHNTFINYENFILNAIQHLNDQLGGRFIIRHSTKILAVSQLTKRYVKTLTDRDVEVLHGAIDHERFTHNGTCKDVRRVLGLPTDKLIVLTVGRQVFKRSTDTFLSTANILKDDPRVLFIAIGDGPDHSRLKEYIRVHNLSNCVLTGSISHKLLPDYYRAADLFVLPSRTGEGLCIVLLEAMASGVPVIATKAGGQVEIIREGYNGHLVESRRADQIARIVRNYLENPSLLIEIGKRGRSMIVNNFDWDIHVDRFLSVLEEARVVRRDQHLVDRLPDHHPAEKSTGIKRDKFGSVKDEELALSIIMPCLNEAETILDCVNIALEVLDASGLQGEIIIVDNGSTDGSVDIVRSLKSNYVLVVNEPRQGYGSAFLKGLSVARGEFVVMAHADGTYYLRETPKPISILQVGYDIVMGSRLKGHILPGAMPWLHRYIGVPFLTWLLRQVTRYELTDAHCGLRAAKRNSLRQLALRTKGMEFASEMLIKASLHNLLVKEIPITYYSRKGRSKLRTFRDGWRHLRFILAYRSYT